MPPQQSGRTQKFLASTRAELADGESLDRLVIFLPNGDVLDLSTLGEAPEAGPVFNPQGIWTPGEYEPGMAVMHEHAAYYTPVTTSEVPGVTGAPLIDDDQIQTTWIEPGELLFDTGGENTPDGAPFGTDPYAVMLYVPVTHVGHVQIAIESETGQYVGYKVWDPDLTLVATGQSDASIGIDFDELGTYYVALRNDSGDQGLVVANVVYSAGFTATPAPVDNPWIMFADANP